MLASEVEAAERPSFGTRRLFSYLWPDTGSIAAKLRVLGALALLLVAKLFVVRVPFLFKRCIESLSAGTSVLAPAGWMLAYGFARAVYTLLQEGRYLLFTPVGQNALRRFMRDAFEHVQNLDAGWLGSQSTGELSRVFARGVRGMNSLLRLLVFNVLPTALEAALVINLLGRRYGSSFLLASGVCVGAFVTWSLWVVEQRVVLLQQLNDKDNRIFTRFFNSLLNNEAVRLFTNERHEVRQYDGLLSEVEELSVRDVQTVSLLNAGQALIFSTGLASVMALCARRVLAGSLTVGDVVAIHGMLLQLQAPLTSLGFTYQARSRPLTSPVTSSGPPPTCLRPRSHLALSSHRARSALTQQEIRQSLTDMRQLLQLLRRTPKVQSRPSAPELAVSEGVLRFEDVSFSYNNSPSLRNVSFSLPARKKTAIVGASGSGESTVLGVPLMTADDHR